MGKCKGGKSIIICGVIFAANMKGNEIFLYTMVAEMSPDQKVYSS